MESKLLLNALLELLSLLQRQRVGLGNDGDNIDNIRQLLEHDDINRLKRVSRRLDEEEAAVDASVLNVALTLGSELLSKVRGVLVLDILDDGVPAPVVVDQISIARSVNNVESKADAILLDDVRNGLDFGGLADDLFGVKSTLGLDKVGGKDGVDQGRLSETSLAFEGVAQDALVEATRRHIATAEGKRNNRQLTDTDDIELETALEELALDLGGDAVETDVALGVDGGRRHGRHCG